RSSLNNQQHYDILYSVMMCTLFQFFFLQAEDGIRDRSVTGVQTCALPISPSCHFDLRGTLFLPRISILNNGPVIPSNPVAKTMISSSTSSAEVLMPFGVICSMGFFFTSIKDTLSRLNLS